jgi:NAD(P)-dependent dehydrogenase (short-subunit alcohol dehydrogenase family)
VRPLAGPQLIAAGIDPLRVSRLLALVGSHGYGLGFNRGGRVTRALITGCSTGIGRATAVELTKRGYDVVATARRPEVLDDLDVAQRLALDVTAGDSIKAAVAAAGEIDVLVNNAGIGVGGPVECVPIDRAQAMFETNVWGPARMVQALAPGMRARNRGAIVNVTSLAGRAVGPLNGFYAASKWALEALSEAIYLELAHWGIKVIAIEPGYIATPMLEKDEGYGTDVPPYDELGRIWEAASTKLSGGDPPGPELVAAAIADALEDEEPVLRHPVGADAEMVVAARESMSYEQFVASMRDLLGLDW